MMMEGYNLFENSYFMRGFVKNYQYSNLQELTNAAKDISKEEYRFQEVFKNIV